MKISVYHHSSVVIIQNGQTSEFMFQEYDGTYPRVVFRKKVHLIGGNYQPRNSDKGIAGDDSPRALLEREIREEFSPHEESPESGIESYLVKIVGEGPGAQRVGEFAPLKDIEQVRDEVILTAIPYKDALFHVPEIDGKNGFSGVVSIYHSSISPQLFELTRRHISEGRAIRNEGLTKLASGEDIIGGKVPSAWYTKDIMGDFLGNLSKNEYGITVEFVEGPQDSWESYLSRFEYSIPIK